MEVKEKGGRKGREHRRRDQGGVRRRVGSREKET